MRTKRSILWARLSRESVPRAMQIRRSLPKALVRTGKRDSRTCSNSRALPPPGALDARSVMCVISRSLETGAFMRSNSPAFSSSDMNSPRFWYALFIFVTDLRSRQDPEEEQNGYCAVYVEKGDVHLVQAIRPDQLVLGKDQGTDEQKKKKINSSEIEGKIDQEQKDKCEHMQSGGEEQALLTPPSRRAVKTGPVPGRIRCPGTNTEYRSRRCRS